MTGCNSVGEYHYQHIKNNFQKYVTIQDVECIPISQLLDEYNVTSVDYVKIDTEGSDSYIMEHYINYLKTKDKSYYPKKIKFEVNQLCNTKHTVQIIVRLRKELGYKITQMPTLFSPKNIKLKYEINDIIVEL